MTEPRTEIDVKREPSRAAAPNAPDWEPIRSLRHQIDRLMTDFDWPDFRLGWSRRPIFPGPSLPDVGIAVPAVDLVEKNGGYEVQAELPGLTRDQVEVRVADGVLTIKGEKSAEREDDQNGYYLRERSYGSFQRTFRVPAGVETDKIEAKFENGVLKVSMPKSAAAVEKERKIDIKPA